MINPFTKTLRLLPLVLCVLLPITFQAQNISGRVVDEKGNPIPYASVVAMHLPDSTFLDGVTTDNDGRFMLDLACNLLKITFIGYEPCWIKSPKGEVGNITMNSEAKMLNEVSIVAKKPLITNLPDRIVVEVEKSILANTINGMEMLRLTPRVWVDPLGSISVLGKGTPIIYINNHRVQSLSEVESLDPQFIKSVDVIDTPSAKYDADAVAVIKITTLRRSDFYNVRIGGDLSRHRDWNEKGFVDVNFLKNKFSGNIYYGLNESRTRPIERSHYKGSNGYLIHTDYTDNLHYGNSHNLRASAEYAISPRHSIGWQGNARIASMRNVLDKVVHNESPDASDFHTPSGAKGHNNMYYSTLYYNWDINKKGQKLTATFDYTHSDNDNRDTLRNIPLGGNYLDYVLNTNSNTGSSDVLIGKLDYSLPLGKKFKLNIGSKCYGIFVKNLVELSGFTDYRNDYESDERNISGYVEGLWTLSERWSVIAGLRGERMHRSNSENGITQLDFIEQGLYPRLNIQFIPAESYSIRASYSKTVTRPSFTALNPSYSVMDSLANNMGEPTLTNSFSHNFSLSVSFPLGIGASVYYHRIVNPIIQYFQTSAANPNVLEGRWYNGNPYNSYSANVWANFSPTSWWFLYFDLSYNQNCYVFEVDGVAVINDKPRFRGMIANTIELPKDWTIAVNLDASTACSGKTVINERLCNLYFQVNKTLFKKALNVTLSFNDILDTYIYKQQSLLRGEQYSYFDMDRRGVTLSASYKFGKAKKSFRSRTIGDEERQRLTE